MPCNFSELGYRMEDNLIVMLKQREKTKGGGCGDKLKFKKGKDVSFINELKNKILGIRVHQHYPRMLSIGEEWKHAQ